MSEQVLVDDDGALEALCRRLADQERLALDTEFVRERTYHAQLCLIQVRAGGESALIDPLSGIDPTPFRALMADNDVEKVLHAARQDLEVLAQGSGSVPAPIFDTQVAAALTGHGDQIGYAGLVKALLGVELEKGETRTDWSRRPLSPKQLDYALDDVRYLLPLREALGAELERRGRTAWMEAEMRMLTDPALYRAEPAEARQRIRNRNPLSARSEAALHALAAWREEQAMSSDRPRGWILKDGVLLEIASRLPEDRAGVEDIEGLAPATLQRHGDTLARLVAEAIEGVPDSPAPEPPGRDPELEALSKRLMKRVRERAAELDLSAPLLATRRDVEALLAGEQDLPLLRGWRAEVIGRELLEEIQGA